MTSRTSGLLVLKVRIGNSRSHRYWGHVEVLCVHVCVCVHVYVHMCVCACVCVCVCATKKCFIVLGRVNNPDTDSLLVPL